MKKYIVMIFGILSLFATTGVETRAQDWDGMVVKVPFVFTVKNTTLPDGEYRISRLRPSVYLIQNTQDAQSSTVVTTINLRGRQQASTARLIFRARAGQHFLSEVWGPAAQQTGQAVPTSKAERRLAREVARGATAAETVTLIAER